MEAVSLMFHFVGSLSFLLFGMNMMSEGIQKSAGRSLRRVMGFITGNRFLAVLTGLLVTCVVQSSSATTVMIVTFVNSGILTLAQGIGTIFGANIGTTFTAWIVSLVGFKFKIAVFAIPIFGIGFILTAIKRLRKKEVGQALMGFGLLFLGLEWLGESIPKLEPETINMLLTRFSGGSAASLIAGIAAGTIITVILDSSSAVTALIITMAHNGLLTWEFSAALVLGSNIGTTTDVIFASIGASDNAKRAAAVHVFFNITGSVIAAVCFKPLIALVDFVTPGTVSDSLETHIAMFHTMFNVCCTALFLPFVTQIAHLTEGLIKSKGEKLPAEYRFDFAPFGMKENADAFIIRAEKEIAVMMDILKRMFSRIQRGIQNRTNRFIDEQIPELAAEEQYIDLMREELSKYFLRCYDLPLDGEAKNNIPRYLGVIGDIERASDDCYALGMLIKKSVEKEMDFDGATVSKITPYFELAEEFIRLVETHLNKRLDLEGMQRAVEMEEKIDASCSKLKKEAVKRLEKGANVKRELLYMDIIRNVERLGDCAYSISRELSQMQ